MKDGRLREIWRTMDGPAIKREVVIGDRDPLGLHLRPAELFAKLALKFESDIEVIRGSLRVDAKSIMHVLTLGADPGTQLTIEARGPDAQQAVDALARLVERDFVSDESMSQGQSG
ncbi:MAG: HPr family phosphocarrier protein [Planctomycetota bacterium]